MKEIGAMHILGYVFVGAICFIVGVAATIALLSIIAPGPNGRD
ncbi:MAG: hypothetical protein WAN05_06905 [Roseiarcus sp.]